MNEAALAKLKAKTAQEVCQHFPLSDKARPLLKDGQTPGQLFKALVEGGCLVDAVRLLAHALPKPEAVGWACLAARTALGDKPDPKAAAALEAAKKWVLDPSEANRRGAEAAGKAVNYEGPAGLAAVAAFWSGGSLAPPDLKAVPPGEQLTAKGVANAVILAGVLSQPEKAPEKYRRFLDLGVEIAGGATPWR
jgi:hypothetical protein